MLSQCHLNKKYSKTSFNVDIFTQLIGYELLLFLLLRIQIYIILIRASGSELQG